MLDNEQINFLYAYQALAGIAQWIERGLWTKGSLVRFPVRVHAWVVGQVPSRGGEWEATTH